jgi:Tfp pilus assembly protein PilX
MMTEIHNREIERDQAEAALRESERQVSDPGRKRRGTGSSIIQDARNRLCQPGRREAGGNPAGKIIGEDFVRLHRR